MSIFKIADELNKSDTWTTLVVPNTEVDLQLYAVKKEDFETGKRPMEAKANNSALLSHIGDYTKEETKEWAAFVHEVLVANSTDKETLQ